MTSLTIPPYNTDLDAWRARIEEKRAANHARWAAEQAAKESQRNPRKVKPVATEACDECGTHYVRRQENQRFCSKKCRDRNLKRKREAAPPSVRSCIECGRLTRPNHTTTTDYPGTLLRGDANRCKRCYGEGRPAGSRAPKSQGLRPCAKCGRMTRAKGSEPVDGIPRRYKGGMCKPCAVPRQIVTGRTCPACGKRIPDTAQPRRVYCNAACRKRDYRATAQEVAA